MSESIGETLGSRSSGEHDTEVHCASRLKVIASRLHTPEDISILVIGKF